jgi:aromatic-L-amino-acid/L-tryptophan decarboxylase
LNKELLTRLQASGEAFVSNAIVYGKFALRGCIVNFRTTDEDLETLVRLVVRIGAEVEAEALQRNK